ncbi:MAG: photosystem I reaction center subunit PsaK [Microcoleus sp. PH2017_29_MFU_D_A]|jgi:photosystem I subunit X|uniref:photosystem I reaction center subunit PsaK n=1 Tax=unclassified Microcoleus TaxID=2642155 RepID=UPI001D683457|nr:MULTISPECIES: photosystem I reaction center subunit PsaK [unclassified Microcoleus]MCC3441830.1 photosystem I reaction center subunit PsaK [Microcoleus sp. PH2017_03_ELD_O_A]MCC3465861.1 photosystem I reaction center subunit PsaK [Microcoleus sp. PH2017_06_SFM_O_A]MCC3502463.1 photosystem I reaction center subunit PsaK [Microcoleus sp. PH2017_19_SFW_U_A]TAE14491.1 MAG: photosystem I reaction center subunit PsaK [Oscillatoriales cyanobacterium]MCC3412294.1 photosystem I reaction center subun
MINSSLLLAVPSATALTVEWTPMVGLTMIICNLLAIAIGYYGINKQNRGKGPALPVAVPGMFKGFGIPELLATTSLGHLLGAGVILGLGNAGVL